MSYRDILFLKDSELLPGVMTIIYDLVEARRREIALENESIETILCHGRLTVELLSSFTPRR